MTFATKEKLVIGAILLACAVCFIGTVAYAANEDQSRVFVLREYMCETDKGPAKVVEYFVDGLPSVAVFYDGDAEKLEAFRKYLERVGR